MLSRVAEILDSNVDVLIEDWAASLEASPDTQEASRFNEEVRKAFSQMLRDIAFHLDPSHRENGEWREATLRAQRLGRIRQEQGFRLDEVMCEYLVLREKVWTLFRERLRREDEPFLQCVAVLNEVIDALLLSTAESFYRAHVEELERWAATDSLTGLLNRRYFFTRLGEELARSQRSGESFSVLMLDLDQFKRYNDTYGHQAGDALLVKVAQTLRRALRSHDVVARYGGDEFILLLPNSGLDPRLLAHRIVLAIEHIGAERADQEMTDTSARVGISIGIARYPADGLDADSLIAAADAALYRAKTVPSHIWGGEAARG